ncbi:MAG: hypothetical protein R6W71_05750, partial [Bacteroidales bacterium]
MKTKTKLIALAVIIMAGITTQCTRTMKERGPIPLSSIDEVTKNQVIAVLREKYGDAQAFRFERGVSQVAGFWNDSDGTVEDFKTFCVERFIADEDELALVFDRLSAALESLFGSYNKISVDLKIPIHVPIGPIHPVDEILGGYSPGAHFADDMFGNKLAFIVLLNFPFYSLDEKTEMGDQWSRRQWAYARMGELFTSRVPGALNQEVSRTLTDADNYITEYNIYMGKLRDSDDRQLFPDDMRLISHWGIRDELKSNYSAPEGFEKQKMIYEVMLRIIRQEIPEDVINSDAVTWDPFTNEVYKDGEKIAADREPDTRYQVLLDNFKVLYATDPYHPFYPTYIQRAFDRNMEIPQREVEELFVALASSPEVKMAGELISSRLGRPLEPFDIWYDGFKARSSMNEEELSQITRARYPDNKAFEKDLTNILVKLG